jgi:hypothetical protein
LKLIIYVKVIKDPGMETKRKRGRDEEWKRGGSTVETRNHGLINYIDTKAKCLNLKKLKRDFAAGVYQRL